MTAKESDDMFAPPVNRAMRVLDRGFFQKTIPAAAARIFDRKDISRCRDELHKSRDVDGSKARIKPVWEDPDAERAKAGGKCLLLRPEVLPSDPNTWSPRLRDLESSGVVGVIPFSLRLDYNDFTYWEIMNAIIPPSDTPDHDELPTGFSMAGHVAHLNLRKKYWPYKSLIAEVLADKNANIKTVINKLDDVGTENEFRTFQYEVLYGPDDLNVTQIEQGCVFEFNFAKVYWNSRLHTEHERLCALFNEGEAICDVMAGIGPFAIPAGKKKCFVYANDLNPESSKYLSLGIIKNKVADFVQAYNEDARTFIQTAAAELVKSDYSVPIYPKIKSSRSKPTGPPTPLRTIYRPRIFSHYVMNLPATALTFLPSFIGLYSHVPGLPAEDIRMMLAPHTNVQLPMIHAHCFSTKSDDNVAEKIAICKEISQQLDFTITPDTPELNIHDVRDVAPNKRMFCASFRLPEEVAFRKVE
ncbi:guanine(37)-N1-methyltransferase [Amniculicola lignicola CBS 123094]|uniref:tRNA (guanine(37)-N1)-methyltransferase n=1 Tax=Amniculicola lignicola CBS 123094 TaxID=1392246 RepID=A0A6A5W8N9_9PLEO|nr:guanine(37)-N1-methyltransferase [Amniculicola lignicola CBS 123094]